MAKEKRGIAVLLPGIGYTCDKPLLYYSAKLTKSMGYEVFPVPFSGFPAKKTGDASFISACAGIAESQTEATLKSVAWNDYSDILFISKSIGTIAATHYACTHDLRCRHVLLTPLVPTFANPPRCTIAFHGNADPWADTGEIARLCAALGIELCLTEGANHSLETGDLEADLCTLQAVMRRISAFIAQAPRC